MKVSLNEAAISNWIPQALRAVAACSLDEPVPKLLPPTRISPFFKKKTKKFNNNREKKKKSIFRKKKRKVINNEFFLKKLVRSKQDKNKPLLQFL